MDFAWLDDEVDVIVGEDAGKTLRDPLQLELEGLV
jgi:hypothetical protein